MQQMPVCECMCVDKGEGGEEEGEGRRDKQRDGQIDSVSN